MSLLDPFKVADQVLHYGIQGISELITAPGLIDLDFADVRSMMARAGSALMGAGSSRGEDRAVAAAKMAISSQLLEQASTAPTACSSVPGGSNLGLFEVNEAAQLMGESAA